MTKVEPTSSSILDAEWWPFGVAAGWVLSRNERFAVECHQETNPPIAAVRNAAYQWRWDIKVDGCSLGRRPIMLFPSEEIAAEQLQAEVDAARIRCEDNAYSAVNIRSRFPQIDYPDRVRVAASMWQGQDPNKCRRISLSHAAWWIASTQGTTPFALDDRAAWASAFTPLLQSIVDKDVQVFGVVAQPPVQKVPADSFDGVPVEYPARASEGSGGSPYQHGYHAFVAADLLAHGDRYYARGKREAIWRGLQLSTVDLLKCFRKNISGSGPGAPVIYDWDEGFQFMIKELTQRGDPLKENATPGWKSDADVGRAVAAHLLLKDGAEPDHKHVMKRIKPELIKWRGRA